MDEPKTFDDLLNYIEKYAASIFVREKVNGKWDAVSLAALPGDRAIHHALLFIRGGIIPVRVRSDEEVNHAN